MARELVDHRVNGVNDGIQPCAGDHLTVGQAPSSYVATWATIDADGNADPRKQLVMHFQDGPIGEVGVNGITHEVLLAIVADRLRCFQAGPYACTENALALAHVECAMQQLHARTKARVARGVEGTHQI